MIYSIFRKEDSVSREEDLCKLAKKHLGDEAVRKIAYLLKLNPPEFGYRMAKARLKGALSSLEYPESAYQERKREKQIKKEERQRIKEEKNKQVLTATLMERFRTRDNSKRKPA